MLILENKKGDEGFTLPYGSDDREKDDVNADSVCKLVNMSVLEGKHAEVEVGWGPDSVLLDW